MKTFTMILMMCLIPNIVWAITIEKAIEYAFTHVEDIHIATSAAKDLEASGKKAIAFTKPQASFNATYVRMDDNKDAPPSNPMFDLSFLETPEQDYSAEISASQVLFAGGRIWKSWDLDKNLQKQAKLDVITQTRTIRKNVRLAFDNVLYEQAAVTILQDRLKQRKAELEDATDRYNAGASTSLDVRQAKLYINFAQNELQRGQTSLDDAIINFNQAIGHIGDVSPYIPEGSLEEVNKLNNIKTQLNEKKVNGNFHDLKSLKTQVKSAELNYQISRGEHFPTIGIFASAKTNGEEYDDMDESWNCGVQMSWNFLDGGMVRAKKASGRAQMHIATYNLKKLEKALKSQVEILFANITSIEKQIQLQKEAVMLSKANYEDARGHYRAGTLTLTQMGEFELSYAESRFNLNRLYFAQKNLLTQAMALIETE